MISAIDWFFSFENEGIILEDDLVFENSFTKIAEDWELFLKIECKDIFEARKIERHIKKMKSKKYLENLKKYPEIIKKLNNTEIDL